MCFKLNKSTPAGLRADNNFKEGLPTKKCNFQLSSRSCTVYIEMRICDKIYEALCDCSTSVSCLSPQFNDKLKLEIKLKLKLCYRKLRAANRLFIQEEDVLRSPVIKGPKSYEHSSSVLDKS